MKKNVELEPFPVSVLSRQCDQIYDDGKHNKSEFSFLWETFRNMTTKKGKNETGG